MLHIVAAAQCSSHAIPVKISFRHMFPFERQRSLADIPASACLRKPIICASVNPDYFIAAGIRNKWTLFQQAGSAGSNKFFNISFGLNIVSGLRTRTLVSLQTDGG